MKKAIITLAAVALTLAGVFTALGAKESPAASNALFVTAADNNSDSEPSTARFISQDDFIKAANQTVNGVVSVKSFATPQRNRRQQQQYFNDPFFEFFFGSPNGRRQQPQQEEQEPQQIGLGSGVIINTDGYIVTNNHVIADAERLEVTLNDNRNFAATVVGADEATDLALIKIEAPDLHVIPMGNSENLKVGEWVLAVGNPFGFTSTVTSGIVSAKARNISSTTGMQFTGGIESYIQTDAAVNRGNSGGALVNLKGELVGINTAIYSQTGTYAGCSFAIPTSIVQKVVSDLHTYGTVQRAYLGIAFRELTPEFIAKKGIEGPTAGIYVMEVIDRSAALEAGLKEGDIVVELSGRPTRSTAELQEAITSFSPGDEVTLTYWRAGKKHTATAVMRNNRGDVGITRVDNESALGATFAQVDAELARKLRISHGVAVNELEPDGLFAKYGIKAGFIILAINGNRITSADDITNLFKAITKSDSGLEKVMFISGIYPSGKQNFYAVPLNE